MTDIVVNSSDVTVEVVSPNEATVDVVAGQDTIVVNPPDFAYIAVHDTTNQADGNPNLLYQVSANTVDSQYLINHNAGLFTFLQKGLYSITFSIQWQNSDANSVSTNVFMKKNNQPVPASSSYTSVPSKHGSTAGGAVTTVNFFERFNVNDTLALWWKTDNSLCTIKTIPATVSPEMPLSPSVVITIVQVS